jgi:hypothetical protein
MVQAPDFGGAHDLGSAADFSVDDLAGADFAGADLAGADLSRADLAGADLAGADLAAARDLSTADHTSLPASLVISQIRSRGAGGASDEFVELYNAGASSVTLDNTWTLDGRSSTGSSFSGRWTGAGQLLPSHGHLLLGGSAYTQTPPADAALSTGITDASALRLVHAGATVDVVCYAFDATSRGALTGDATYGCPGTPADNSPHDNTTSAASNSDHSIERKPGGAGGNGASTGDNSVDFAPDSPAVPRDLASPAAP